MTADRHLLFGLLALQNEFIDKRQLVAAFGAWIANSKKPLDEVLVEQGALSVEDRALLSRLVDRHVAARGGDVEASLRSLSSAGSVRDELDRIADNDVKASIAKLRPVELATMAPTVGQSTSAGQRFEIRRPLDRGGLGIVSVAVDKELNREVALKEIRGDRADDQAYRSKFLLEAEVTGGLEHPGIVPVYGLGTGPDGRPYYAMRLIKGDNLLTHIRHFHESLACGKNPYEGSELRKLLRRFMDVCQAIDYAHSRGVLHRDLKPGNVMLGKYGETLVVDWGLAKPQSLQGLDSVTEAESCEPSLIPSRSNDGMTAQGSIVGTAAYAPPEQLSGMLEKVDVRSDVYGLGSILYELLTGIPPAQGDTLEDIVKAVTAGRIKAPRLTQPCIPKPLEAVCLKAISLRPNDRYTSAVSLSNEVERWLDDMPVEAYAEPLYRRARRWLRAHRAVAATATAVLLMTMISTGLFSLLVDRNNRQLTRLNHELDIKNSALDRQNRELKSANQREAMARKEAEINLQRSEATKRNLLTAITSADPNQMGRSLTLVDLLDRINLQLSEALKEDPATKVELLSALGWSYKGLGETAKAQVVWRECYELQKQLKEPADSEMIDSGIVYSWSTIATDPQVGVAVLSALRESLERNEDVSQQDRDKIDTTLGDLYRAANQPEKGIPLLKRLLMKAESQGELTLAGSTVMHNLALCYIRTKQFSEAVDLLERVSALYGKTHGPTHPVTLDSLGALAYAHSEAGGLQKAIELYQKIIPEQVSRIGFSHADTLNNVWSLAECCEKQALEHGRNQSLGQEIEFLQRSVELRKSVDEGHWRTFNALSLLGDAVFRKSSLTDSIEENQARLLMEQAESMLSSGHDGLLRQQGSIPESDKQCLQAAEQRVQSFLMKTDSLEKLALWQTKSGVTSSRHGLHMRAIAFFAQSLETRGELAKERVGDPMSLRNLVIGHRNLANAHAIAMDFDSALVSYGHADQILQKMIEQSVHVKSCQNEKAAIAQLSASVHVLKARVEKFGLPPEETNLPRVLNNRIVACVESGDLDEALDVSTEMMTLFNIEPGFEYNAACVYALAASASEQGARRDQLVQDALKALKKAVKDGYADFDHIQQDPDLEALRSLPEFRALLSMEDMAGSHE